MKTIKMKTTTITEGEDGKLYRELKGKAAVDAADPVKGEVGEGDKVKRAFYEEIKPAGQ